MNKEPRFPFVATVTDCRHSLYGREVTVQAKSGSLRMVKVGSQQLMIAKIHLQYERAA